MKKEYFETTSTIIEGDVKRFIRMVHYEAMCNLDDGLTIDYIKKLERMIKNHIELEQYEIAEGLKMCIETLTQ
jgi:hypothetical protein